LEQPITLALDIGTSSVRAGLYDGAANPVPQSSVKIQYSFNLTGGGAAELDAEKGLFFVTSAIDAVLEKTKDLKTEIELVAISAYWHSLVGVDAKDKPTTKVLGWADTRSRKYAEDLRQRFDDAEIHDRTGAHFHSSYWPSKLLWFRKEFPDTFARTKRWLAFSDYVSLKLLGKPVTTVSMASGTGLFDIRECKWDRELLRFLKVRPADLPEIADPGDAFQLGSKYARRWPRLRNTVFFPAVADGAADNVGSGCLTKRRAALMVGTSGAMRIAYSGKPPTKIPVGLWCYRIDHKRVILGGALSDGGGLYQWLQNNLTIPTNTEDEMRLRGAAAHGLTFLPFLAGERSTGYNDYAAGAITGLTTSHDSIDILQAGMESVAYRFAEIFDRLPSVLKINEIVASGGALRDSPVWSQIIADVLGRDLTVSGVAESSSRGAVLLALESIGKIEAIDDIPLISDSRVTFHPECHALYKNARKQHQAAYLRSINPK
jgi:gluconokinase